MTTAERLSRRANRTAAGCLEVEPYPGHRYAEIFVSELGVRMGAHRAAWFLANGPIPDGMCVCHRCDNPKCVEVSHLFIGTMADNMHDRDAKGRNMTMGSNSPLSKLDENGVRDIRVRSRSQSVREIASAYSVCQATIKRILTGETWAYVV